MSKSNQSQLWSNGYSTISNLREYYLVKNILLQVSSILKILNFWNKFRIIIYFLLLQKKKKSNQPII